MPILAATVLVGLFSQGENTDVWAHVFGFFSGLFSGIIFFPLNTVLTSRHKETIALAITITIIAAAFLS